MNSGCAPERSFGDLLVAAKLCTSRASVVHLSRIPVQSISSDSRVVQPNGCFVAIAGGCADGRTFVAEAIDRGASAVVCESEVSVPSSVGMFRVACARTAVSHLAAAFYGLALGQRFDDLSVVGVTGTNGKTTTCFLLKSILEAAGRVTAMVGTIGYDLVGESSPARWTTPPAVELYAGLAGAARRGATAAVMEVSSHALSQSRCVGHRFCGGVFTNLSGDHLDYHGSMAEYARAKKRLFDGLSGDAWAVVNADDAVAMEMVANCRASCVRFAIDNEAEIRASIEEMSAGGSTFTLHTPHGSRSVRLAVAGRHNIMNALAAVGAAINMGVTLSVACDGLEAVRIVPGRLQRVPTGDRDIGLFVDYAHTDDALTRVLDALLPLTRGRLVCVFGCGGDRDRSKRPRMGSAVAERADVAVVTSDNPRHEPPDAIIEEILSGMPCASASASTCGSASACEVVVEPDRERAIEFALGQARPGDTVLIAGKGHEDYQIVGDERRWFDDVEIATRYVAGTDVTAA